MEVADRLLRASLSRQLEADRNRADLFARLMDDPAGQVLTTALTDRLYRSRNASRLMSEVAHLLERLGIPRYMSSFERLELSGARYFSWLAPGTMAGAVLRRVRDDTRDVLLSAEHGALTSFLGDRKADGVAVNVNHLGEALLGEQEAERRVQDYEALARRDDLEAVSVKVSSIGSQLELLAFEETVATLTERLCRIYRASLESAAPPVVMLDMESYHHVELTMAVLRASLSRPENVGVRAGVVVQAYLPECCELLGQVIHLSQQHVARGGQRLRVRIVKGANLAQERVESAALGWRVPILPNKQAVDANYKRALLLATSAPLAGAVKLGVASHNLFDIAYGLVLREERGLRQDLSFELLEGMAEPLRRALSDEGVPLLAYAPIVDEHELHSGIAYLVRRLDENTDPENFLHDSFGMRPDDAAWQTQRRRFLSACADVESPPPAPARHGAAYHDRNLPPRRVRGVGFSNECDTDFATAPNRAWIRDKLGAQRNAHAPEHCSVIAGAEVPQGVLHEGFDPSEPTVVPYRFRAAAAPDIQRALQCAAQDPAGWADTTTSERSHLLLHVAQLLRNRRGELIASMVMDAGKRVQEADAEVSEAIDFAEYYRQSALDFEHEAGVHLHGRGTVLIAPPWNFPLAIGAGGVFAALMAGNRVLFKPALETIEVGVRLAELCWEAGVPREVLQLVLCEDEEAGAMVRDPSVDAVVLTGATSTARLLQQMRPGLHLSAETGGKNALIVSAMSDRELAAGDAVRSAFGHAGQKCSAASLLICEAEVYDDPKFLETLRDAAASLQVGPAWDARSVVTPLIHPPHGPLARALDELEPGESWLLPPRRSTTNPRQVSPGIKLGVREGSFTHTTELFGPVLGVMRADDFEHALRLASSTGYGLTAGLHSLDEREQRAFIARMPAGNLYVNRAITGAIVRRQPFGGMGKSGYGPGAKAGGPNYVAQLSVPRPVARAVRRLSPQQLPDVLSAFAAVLSHEEWQCLQLRWAHYGDTYRDHFAQTHDPSRVLGQDNLLRYLPSRGGVIRVGQGADWLCVASTLAASLVAGSQARLSLTPGLSMSHSIAGAFEETVDALAQAAPGVERVRLIGSEDAELLDWVARCGAHLDRDPVSPRGRVEVLRYLQEQTVSIDYHRYGNLGERVLRSGDQRSPSPRNAS